jgi:predicted DNA-binding transcriptional regulator AlpA
MSLLFLGKSPSRKGDDPMPALKKPLPKSHHIDRRADRVDVAGGNDDDLLTTGQISEWFGLSHQWFELGRVRGYGPKFVRTGPSTIRYRRGDARQWLKQRTHQSTAEYAE